MFIPDDAIRVVALSEYVGRWVALGTTALDLQPDGFRTPPTIAWG